LTATPKERITDLLSCLLSARISASITTFTASDNGVDVLSAALLTRGVQSITASDTLTPSITGTEAGITVQ
jgi:hypothetical protein